MMYEQGKWNASNFDWMKSMADLKKFFGTSALLDINSNQNTNNIKYNTIHVSLTIPQDIMPTTLLKLHTNSILLLF